MKVGTRELKNRLSHYLRQLRDGEPLYVTDRGRVIAEIRPAGAARRKKQDDRAVLRALAEEGDVTLGRGGPFAPFRPIKPKKSVRLSRLIVEERR